jgi:hypothetical protein
MPFALAALAFLPVAWLLKILGSVEAVPTANVPAGAAAFAHKLRPAFAVAAARMQRCLIGPMRGADNVAEFESVILSDFAPAFTGLVPRHKRVEVLASCVSEQIGVFQFAVTKPGRCLLRPQRLDGNTSFIGNPRQDVSRLRLHGRDDKEAYCD